MVTQQCCDEVCFINLITWSGGFRSHCLC